jgi:hypothetical protein
MMSRFLSLLLFLFATSAFGQVVNVGAQAGVKTYANEAALPATAKDGATAVTLDDHAFWIFDGSTWNELTGGGGGGMVLNDPITGAAANPILYGGAGGTLAQTSTFVYDYTNGRLGIGTATPSNPIQLVHAGTSGTAVVVQATDTSNGGNGITVQKSGTGRGILIQQTSSGTGRGLEVTSSNAANTNPVVVVTGTHAGYGISATTSAGSAQNYTASFGNLSTTAPAVSGGVYGSVRSTASANTAGVIGEVIGSGIGSGFFAVRNAAGTSLGLATNLGAGVRLSPQYAMSSSDNYNLEFPLVQGGAGTTLINDGAGVFTWGVPTPDWAAPGTIGSTTPNTGAFTTIDATRIEMATGDTSTTCMVWDADTGICSSGDGEIEFFNNGFENFGLSQNSVNFEGVPYAFPGSQGAAATTLTNDGSGNLSWSPVSLSSLNVSQTKTTTNSETMNSLGVTYSPTGASDDMNTLNVVSTVSTDQDVNSITGANFNTTSTQDSNTGTVNGVAVNLTAGNTGNTIDNVNPFIGYANVADGAAVGAGYVGVNLTLDTGTTTTLNSVTPINFGGTMGIVNNANLLNITPNMVSSTNLNGLNLNGNWGDTQGVNALSIAPVIDQAAGTWQTLNEGPDFTRANSYSAWSHHPTADDVTYDYSMVDGGAGIGDVERNVNTFNIHNNFTTVNNSFTGFAEGSNAGTVVGGSLTAFRANTTASVPGDAYMYAAFPTITQRSAANQIVEMTARPDVAGSLGGKYLRICTAYSENPNTCFKAWIDVDNGSTPPSADGDTLLEVDIAEDDTATDVADAIAAALDAEAKLDSTNAGAVVTIEIVADGKAGGLDTGGIDGWDWVYTQGGGGDGYLYGYTFGAGSSSGYGANNIIAFDSGGYPVNFGKINAFTNYTLVSSTPNPANVHTIGSNVSVGDSQTVTDADMIGLGGIGQITIGDNSTVTSGGLKVGATSAGKISLMQAGSSSTVENVTSDLAASILVAGSGTFTNVAGYRAVNANFGASTPMTNYRAFFADAPAGPGGATNTWGLYADGNFVNWMGGGLKIGGTAGSTDQPADSTVPLDVEAAKIRVRSSHTPASSSEACAQGTIAWDADYVYVCVATDTWKRTALATW